MRLVSLNLNKRLGNKTMALCFNDWLKRHNCDVAVVQEPWAHSRSEEVRLPDFREIGGNSKVYAWIAPQFASPSHLLVRDNWLRLELGYFVVDNMYFSAYSQKERRDLFDLLTSNHSDVGDKPRLIVGDFNFAPEPEDGMDGDSVSRFNSPDERDAFKRLLGNCSLVDASSPSYLGTRQFTIVRRRQDKEISFRCDLALVSDFVKDAVCVVYDHSSRSGPMAFTDHSALVVDAPVTLPDANLFSLTSPADGETGCSIDEPIQAHKTAMARSEPSKIAKELVESGTLSSLGVRSILDFGCGRGRDVEFYRSGGFDAEGYDPHPAFGWPSLPDSIYDLVTVVFVLNVIPDPWRRIKALREAIARVRPGGFLFVATRSSDTIKREVSAKGWQPFNDGFMSHKGRRTFQKGIDAQELAGLALRLSAVVLPLRLNMGNDTGYILAQKPPAQEL